jgi:hypothetical protein
MGKNKWNDEDLDFGERFLKIQEIDFIYKKIYAGILTIISEKDGWYIREKYSIKWNGSIPPGYDKEDDGKIYQAYREYAAN